MRVLTYNVRAFRQALRGIAATRRSREAIGVALRAVSPAIICLQEIPTAESAATLARGTSLGAHHFVAHETRLWRTGLAILVDERALRVTARSVIALIDDDTRGERRICAHLALRHATDGPLHVFTAHLSLGARLGHGARQLRQAQRLLDFVRTVAGGEPFVLGGDFNARPGTPAHRCLAEALDSPASTAIAPSAGFGPVRLRLDYLFAGNGVRWLDSDGTLPFGDRASAFHGLSDHAPLVSRCALPPARARGTA